MTTHVPVLLPASVPPNPGQPHAIRQAEKSPPHPGWQRTYDYEDKYRPDARGEELNPNARVWKVYMDEAEIYDHDMLQGFRETMDVHLVLAALFSAVIVTCAVQTTLDLDPDYAQITAHLMYEQLQLSRRAPGDVTPIPFAPFTPESATHSNLDVWINGLFYTSLSLSLAAALLSALAKQWLTYYSSNVSGDAKHRSLHRQFRFNGIQKWKLKDMVGFMPVILHLSLAVFLVGFALFVYRRHPFLSSIIIIITGFTFLFYTITTILPAIWPECPYHNPALSRPAKIIVYLATLTMHMLQYVFLQLQYHALHFYYTLCMKLNHIRHHVNWDIYWAFHSLRSPNYPQRLADRMIHHAINVNKDVLVADSLFWLFGETTNPSIQTIVISTGTTSIAHLLPDQRSLLPIVSPTCDILFSPSLPDSDHPSVLSRFLCTVIKEFKYVAPWKDPHPNIPKDLVYLAIANNQTDVVHALLGSDNSHIDARDPSRFGRMLSIALHYYPEDLAAMLLEKGASPNSHPNDYADIPPLWLAIQGNDTNISKCLLENGADLNSRHQFDEHWVSSMCALHIACLRGDIPLLNLLLSYHANPHLTDDDGRSPLHAACAFRQVDAVTILMSLPEPFEIESLGGDRVESDTPLHFLCRGWAKSDDNFDIIADVLLTHDADMINAQNDEGWTPLHVASHAGDIHAIQYLVDHHADTTLTTTFHDHMLHLTCDLSRKWQGATPDSSELIEVIKFWCSKDEHLNINIRDGRNKTPLLRVCESLFDEDAQGNILAIAGYLLSHGADIHAEDKDGRSPLKRSRTDKFDSLTKLLLEKGGGARDEGE